MEDTSFNAIRDFLQSTNPVKLLEEFTPLRVPKKITNKALSYMTSIIESSEESAVTLDKDDLEAILTFEYQIHNILIRTPISKLTKTEHKYFSYVHILLYNLHEAGKDTYETLQDMSLINSIELLLKENLSINDVLNLLPLLTSTLDNAIFNADITKNKKYKMEIDKVFSV